MQVYIASKHQADFHRAEQLMAEVPNQMSLSFHDSFISLCSTCRFEEAPMAIVLDFESLNEWERTCPIPDSLDVLRWRSGGGSGLILMTPEALGYSVFPEAALRRTDDCIIKWPGSHELVSRFNAVRVKIRDRNERALSAFRESWKLYHGIAVESGLELMILAFGLPAGVSALEGYQIGRNFESVLAQAPGKSFKVFHTARFRAGLSLEGAVPDYVLMGAGRPDDILDHIDRTAPKIDYDSAHFFSSDPGVVQGMGNLDVSMQLLGFRLKAARRMKRLAPASEVVEAAGASSEPAASPSAAF